MLSIMKNKTTTAIVLEARMLQENFSLEIQNPQNSNRENIGLGQHSWQRKKLVWEILIRFSQMNSMALKTFSKWIMKKNVNSLSSLKEKSALSSVRLEPLCLCVSVSLVLVTHDPGITTIFSISTYKQVKNRLEQWGLLYTCSWEPKIFN